MAEPAQTIRHVVLHFESAFACRERRILGRLAMRLSAVERLVRFRFRRTSPYQLKAKVAVKSEFGKG